jgi:hypothetical protein
MLGSYITPTTKPRSQVICWYSAKQMTSRKYTGSAAKYAMRKGKEKVFLAPVSSALEFLDFL